ncbi:MAG: hypothetical protein ACRD0O_14545 [Acidimicrobiia bacterium]
MAVRTVLSVVLAAALAGLGGLVLGDYTFQGEGIQWIPIMGGAGLGAVVAWVVNRCWKGAPPVWMAAVAGVLAAWGEVIAVKEDSTGGRSWPGEGWVAIAAAAGFAVYGVVSAHRAKSRS